MSIVGYARVSSVGRSLEVQLDQLAAAGCDKLFSEKRGASSTRDRDQLQECIEWVRSGDVLVVCRLDNLARSIIDLRKILERLASKGVGFRCLQQSALDTTTSDGGRLRNILKSLAEFELDIRKERQRDGIARAKAANTYKGRPPTIDPARVARLKDAGEGVTSIAKKLGISRASVYRCLAGRESAEMAGR